MKAHYIVFESAGKAALRDCEIPELKPEDVLLENDYSVISAGTEGANLRRMPNTCTADTGFPWNPGYSASGRVIAAGGAVKNLKIGDRVIINWGGHRSHTV